MNTAPPIALVEEIAVVPAHKSLRCEDHTDRVALRARVRVRPKWGNPFEVSL